MCELALHGKHTKRRKNIKSTNYTNIIEQLEIFFENNDCKYFF